LMIASIFFIRISGAVRWRGKNTRMGSRYASGELPTLSHSFHADVIG
jgi:hypothetical protein